MRRPLVVLAFGLMLSACGGEATTEASGAPRMLVPVDTSGPADADVDTSTSVTPGPDDACNELLAVILGSEGGVSPDGSFAGESLRERLTLALAALDPDAVAAFDDFVNRDSNMAIDARIEVITTLDSVTLEPCGWPFVGATSAIALATPIQICSDDGEMTLEDGVVVKVRTEEECAADPPSTPDVLPCFSLNPGDSNFPDTWAPVDCASGMPVEWSLTADAWVELPPVPALRSDADRAPAVAPHERTHTLEVHDDGCGVFMSWVDRDDIIGPVGGDSLTWVIRDEDGLQVLGRTVLDDRLSFGEPGTHTVVLEAWRGDSYMEVSNVVTITC